MVLKPVLGMPDKTVAPTAPPSEGGEAICRPLFALRGYSDPRRDRCEGVVEPNRVREPLKTDGITTTTVAVIHAFGSVVD
jgi:hypothetical protein